MSRQSHGDWRHGQDRGPGGELRRQVTYTFACGSAKWSDGVNVRPGTSCTPARGWRPASRLPLRSAAVGCGGYDEPGLRDMTQSSGEAKNDNTLVVVSTAAYDWFLTEVCTSPATSPLRQDVVQKLKEAAEERSQRAGGETLRWWSDPSGPGVQRTAIRRSPTRRARTLSAVANQRYYTTQAGPGPWCSTLRHGGGGPLPLRPQDCGRRLAPDGERWRAGGGRDWKRRSRRWGLRGAVQLRPGDAGGPAGAAGGASGRRPRRPERRRRHQRPWPRAPGAARRPEGEEDFRTIGGALLDSGGESYEGAPRAARPF